MDSSDLYRELLGLAEPWTVERVEMDIAKLRVDVHLAHAAPARFACPEWGKSAACMTTRMRAVGGIWTVATSRRCCTREARA